MDVFFQLDMWTKEMRMFGLNNIHLEQVRSFPNFAPYRHQTLHHQVDIFRSKDLKTLETSIKVGFGDLVISGVYNSTGHMGTVWLQVSDWSIQIT